MDRREALASMVFSGATALETRLGTSPKPPSRLRFRVALMRAIRQQYRAGVINFKTAQRMRRALRSRVRVLGDMDALDVMYNHACGLMMKTAVDWAEIQTIWTSLVEWIVENWLELAKLLANLAMIVLV